MTELLEGLVDLSGAHLVEEGGVEVGLDLPWCSEGAWRRGSGSRPVACPPGFGAALDSHGPAADGRRHPLRAPGPVRRQVLGLGPRRDVPARVAAASAAARRARPVAFHVLEKGPTPRDRTASFGNSPSQVCPWTAPAQVTVGLAVGVADEAVATAALNAPGPGVVARRRRSPSFRLGRSAGRAEPRRRDHPVMRCVANRVTGRPMGRVHPDAVAPVSASAVPTQIRLWVNTSNVGNGRIVG